MYLRELWELSHFQSVEDSSGQVTITGLSQSQKYKVEI